MKRAIPLLVVVALATACGDTNDGVTAATSDTTNTSTTTTVTTPVTTPEVVRQITVGGMGEESAAPDRAVLNLAIHCQRPSVEEATRAASTSAAALVAALQAAGVAGPDIQSSEITINPMYQQYAYPQIVGYEVTLGYRVTMQDPTKVGELLGKAVAAGGDDVRASSVWFHVDQSALTGRAREVAWADARRRAEALAALAGEPLGDVLDVHEKVIVTSPQGAMQGGEGDGEVSIPVVAGVTGVTVLLTVTYALGG